MCRWRLAALVVAVVLLVAVLAARAAAQREAYLAGMWVAEPEFAEQAGLGDLRLFVAPAGARGARAAYLVMTDRAGAFLANTAGRLRAAGGAAGAAGRLWSALGCERYRSRVDLRWDDGAPLPACLTLTLSPASGSLALHDAKRVYAVLVKDLVASPAAIAAYVGTPDQN